MGQSASKRREEDAGAGANDLTAGVDLVNHTVDLQVLSGHDDIVRELLPLDAQRLASASDDMTIKIWAVHSGQLLLKLEGHTLPITCMLSLTYHTLASGSSDRTIRIWDIDTGACKRVLTGHESSIKSLVLLEDRFCSGSNDRTLRLWRLDGKSMGKIERQEEENLNCMLYLRAHKRIVTGSNSSLLLVYRTDTLAFDRLLAYHRESVRCLTVLTDTLFSSSSMDGAIVIWQSESLTPLQRLNFHETFRCRDSKAYIYSASSLLSLGGELLAAAVGNGFFIYDYGTSADSNVVVECPQAHDAEVLQLIFLAERTRLVTCSADSTIRIWACPSLSYANRRRRKNAYPLRPICIGRMYCHTDAVKGLVAYSDRNFASCGADGLVLLWKDSRDVQRLRNAVAALSLRHHAATLMGEASWVTDEPMINVHMAGSRIPPPGVRTPVVQYPEPFDSGDPRGSFSMLGEEPRSSEHEISTDPVQSAGGSSYGATPTDRSRGSLGGTTDDELDVFALSKPVAPSDRPSKTVPDYVWDRAEMLRKEYRLVPGRIADLLKQQGYSASIVTEIMRRQQQQQARPPKF